MTDTNVKLYTYSQDKNAMTVCDVVDMQDAISKIRHNYGGGTENHLLVNTNRSLSYLTYFVCSDKEFVNRKRANTSGPLYDSMSLNQSGKRSLETLHIIEEKCVTTCQTVDVAFEKVAQVSNVFIIVGDEIYYMEDPPYTDSYEHDGEMYSGYDTIDGLAQTVVCGLNGKTDLANVLGLSREEIG